MANQNLSIIIAYRMNPGNCPMLDKEFIKDHPDVAYYCLDAFSKNAKTVMNANKILNNKINKIFKDLLKNHPEINPM